MSMSNDGFDATRNLIVNYLPPSLNQDDVQAMFQAVGPVKNCKLIRNYETGESLGYAFIEFENCFDAESAISKINGLQLEGKTIRVSHARKSSPETKDTNVYVAGLPDWVTDDKLKELFSPYGDVITLKVLDKKSGSSGRGVGFVRYAFKSDAEKAIESMAGVKLEGDTMPLTVKFAIPATSKHQQSTSDRSMMMTSGSMRFNPLASSLTPIMQHQIHQHQSFPSMQPRFTHANNNVVHLPGSGHSSLMTGEVFSLYVYGLLPSASSLTLYELFSPFGGVMNVKVIQDMTKEDKPCKGFGFVNFRKYDEAYHAVVAMNGFLYEGKNLQVSFKQQRTMTASYMGGATRHTIPPSTFPTATGPNTNMNSVPNIASLPSDRDPYRPQPGTVNRGINPNTTVSQVHLEQSQQLEESDDIFYGSRIIDTYVNY